MKLEIFVYVRLQDLMLCWDIILLMQWNVETTYGQEGNQVRIITGQIHTHRKTDSTIKVLVAVAILSECNPDKLQFIIQAVPVAYSPGPVHQDGNNTACLLKSGK
jgi:hypothetical protein